MNKTVEKIGKIGIIPVIAINDFGDAHALGEALCSGGLKCAEVTFRTDAAEESIKALRNDFPQMIVGAGTVLSSEQVDRAISAGAEFVVSPGLNPSVIAHCQNIGVPIIPGIVTPSELEQALNLGLDVVKFFPAELSGGLPMIKAMAAPYSKVMFMPTGGINVNNVHSYLKCDRVIACGGSWMVNPEMIVNKEFDKIKTLTHEAAEIVASCRT